MTGKSIKASRMTLKKSNMDLKKKCIFITWPFKVNNLFTIGIAGYLNSEYTAFSSVSRLM